MNARTVLAKVREHLSTELEVPAERDRRVDAPSRGPRRRLARPLRAGDGARGHLWDQRLRGGGGRIETVGQAVDFVSGRLGADELSGRWRVGSEARLRAPQSAKRGPARARRADRRAARRPAAQARSPTPRGPTTAPDSYGRLAFLGDGVLGLAVAEHLFQPLPARRHRQADQGSRPGGQRARLHRGRRDARPARAAARGGADASSRAGSTSRRSLASASGRWRRSARR